jgi:hypothetical protein
MPDETPLTVDISDVPDSEELLALDEGTAPFINFSQEPLQGVALQHLMTR